MRSEKRDKCVGSVTPWAVSQTTPKNHSRCQGKLSVLKEQYYVHKGRDARLSSIVRLWRNEFQRWEKEAAARLQAREESVTDVTKSFLWVVR